MPEFSGLLAAGPAFFLSAWILMLFTGILAPEVGIRPFGYVTAMVATIGLWLTIAPAVGGIIRSTGRSLRKNSRSKKTVAV